ncbi:MAG: stressosome-associated protein Prli42 [Bacillota bacterium]
MPRRWMKWVIYLVVFTMLLSSVAFGLTMF